MKKPTIPKGTRDFGAEQMARRTYILNSIKHIFELYGFQPLETPAMENLSTLLGKYGQEGDQLVFKILNSGNYLKSVEDENLSENNLATLTAQISEKGLRYDLTVPFARYVVMNRHQLVFPFKRFQMQPVWRADRPQKGRYREFYQCDADIVGTNALTCEAEIIAMINDVFQALSIPDYTISINHRNVLVGLAEILNIKDQQAFFTTLDKLEKMGEDKVMDELTHQGLADHQIKKLFQLLSISGSNSEKLEQIKEALKASETGRIGVANLEEVNQWLASYEIEHDHVSLDIHLARGLSYYTGCIFEVKIHGVGVGSVSGGGRYDNLTAVFDSKDKNSGVGISFGVDRLYDAMSELALFPNETFSFSKILICHLDENCLRYGLKQLVELRKHGISAEIYPDSIKIQKQLDYANKKNIPYALVIGEQEMLSGKLALKDLALGKQMLLSLEEIFDFFMTEKNNS